ncbi:unnamed protein product, partial [Rotaria sp. Silwood1]
MFDFLSLNVFHQDLNEAYTTGRLSCEDGSALRYIDYAIIEQQTPMTAASTFWLDSLRDCKIDHHLSLPFDRHRVSDEHRTGRGISASFSFSEHLSRTFIAYASMSKITLENMALASYYAFLFKLTNGEKDLCIGMNTRGRYKPELMPIIGMFVNVIPLRCKLDPCWSFARLVKEVHQMATDSSHYSYFPLQRILAQHPLVSKPAFLDTSFQFDSNTTQNMSNEIILDDVRLSLVPYSTKIGTDEIIIRFPSNLLKIEYGVTAFGGIMFTSFEMTPKGLCRTNEIHLGSGTNLGNWCVVMPGARLAAKTIVGVYTLVTQETNNCDAGIVLLGIPARKMPF